MPRAVGISVENNFTKGLVTEATGMNFPENAATETYDCVFDEKGIVSRRFGFDVEPSSTPETVDRAFSAVSSYLWKNVTGDGSITFLTVQVGETLYFYRIGLTGSISASLHSDTIDLSSFLAPNSPAMAGVECQYSDGNGLLFVTHPYMETIIVEYDTVTDAISATDIDLEIRDFEGLPYTQAVDLRPTATLAGLSDEQEYNLRNQGWTTANLTAWDTANTTMPSYADVPFYFKDSDDAFDFTSTRIDNILVGNSPAPKGKFILNFYLQDRDAASGMSGIADVSTDYQRASTSAFFAGRLFLSGVQYQGHQSKIFFTQIVEEPSQYSQFYQRNDPTSEILFDLLPSDGGVIVIPGAGTITKLVTLGNNLLVFATQGVWTISGSEGVGFTATDYSISKVASIPAPFPASFIEVDGIPLWWNSDGIYTIAPGSEGGAPQIISLTDSTIRQFYQTIPSTSVQHARGVFNPRTRIIQWLYRSTPAQDITERYEYDRILNLNTKNGSFYPWTISDSDMKVHGAFVIEGFAGVLLQEDVEDSSDQVQDSGEDVFAFVSGTQQIDQKIVYIMSEPNGNMFDLTFGQCLADSNTDWDSVDGPTNYDSYFITGYRLRGEVIRRFQNQYIALMSVGGVDSVYDIQGRWDYATTGDLGRWSVSQRVSQDASPYANRVARRVIRGHGRALQFKINSVDGYPMNIVGWSCYETANQTP